MNRKYSIILVVSIIVVLAVYYAAGGGGKMNIDIGEHSLSIIYEEFSTTVDYKDVAAIELVEVSNFGVPIDGGSDKSFRWGTWENDAWGKYTQYSLTSTSKGVLLHLRDGRFFLLSYESGETTVMLGELLCEMLSTHGYKVEYINSLS